MRTRACQRGFGLVEILVALLIFLVAIVGGAALLTTARHTEYEAYQRSLATRIATAVTERVRINPTRASGSYETASPIGTGTALATPGTDCGSTACNPAQLATFDLWEIDQMLRGNQVTFGDADTAAGGLVNPNACIQLTPDTGKTNTGQLRVIVSWEDRRSTRDAATDAGEEACGGDAGTNPFRRRVVLDSYVMDPAE